MNEHSTGARLVRIAWNLGQFAVLALVVPYYMVGLPFRLLGADRGAVFWFAYAAISGFFLYIGVKLVRDGGRSSDP